MDSKPVSGPGIEPQPQPAKNEAAPAVEESSDWQTRSLKKNKGQATKGLRNPLRRSHSAPSKLSTAKPVQSEKSLKAMQVSAKAIEQDRVFSSTELYKVAGTPSLRSKQLVKLAQLLDQYNQDVASPDSPLSSTEKALRTLELRDTAQAFAQRKIAQGQKFYKTTSHTQQRLQGANAVINQLDLMMQKHIDQDKAGFGKAMCTCLCEDVRQNGGKVRIRLLRQPEMMQKVLTQMQLPELLELSTVYSKAPPFKSPEAIRAMASAVHQVVSQYSSEELRQHKQAHQDKCGSDYVEKVSGNQVYDQGRQYAGLLNSMLDLNPDLDSMGILVHQAYKEGFLTMNMLDELMEQKATNVAMGMDDDETVAASLSQLDPATVESLHVCKKLPPQVDIDDSEHLLWLGKSMQFDAMLKADTTGKDEQYRDFIKTWDRLRFETIPAYSERHNKESLVILDDVSDPEIAKISPAFLNELDAAKGDPDQVLKLLNKKGWRKVSDNFSFKKAIAKANSLNDDKLVEKLRQKACQDCLFRFCEERAEVELPGAPPRLSTLRRPPGAAARRG